MNRSARRTSGLLLLALLLVIFSSAPLRAQEGQSGALVKELTALLDQNKLDSIAAREAQPDGYVAALYYPGIQLMVVGAKYKEPVLLNDRIAKKEYRDVYIDLNSAAVAGSHETYMIFPGCSDGICRTSSAAPVLGGSMITRSKFSPAATSSLTPTTASEQR